MPSFHNMWNLTQVYRVVTVSLGPKTYLLYFITYSITYWQWEWPGNEARVITFQFHCSLRGGPEYDRPQPLPRPESEAIDRPSLNSIENVTVTKVLILTKMQNIFNGI